MTKLKIHAITKNAPKKQFILEFNKAFAEGNAEFIIQNVSEDIQWYIHGDKQISGITEFTKEINIMKDYTADELLIHTIITHGKEGAINGEMKMGKKTYAFCDIYQFVSTSSNKIATMNSYVIGMEK